jgi:Ala-tRNA(Pro) deacylase
VKLEEVGMIPAAISEYLDRQHARYSLLSHPTAFTAQQEAAAAHVPGGEWAKTVVCFADEEPVMAVVPAPAAVDLERLQEVACARSVRLANERELTPMYRDCEPGAMPPLGPLYRQRVFVDEALTRDAQIAFSAGSHHESIRMPYSEFDRLVHPTVAGIATHASARSLPRTAALTDPVCGDALRNDATVWRSELRGETYCFCSQSCKMEFDDNPFAYVGR